MSGFVAKTLVFGVIILAIVCIGIFEARSAPELSDEARTALREFGMDRTYAMRVETFVGLGDRDLTIDGIYRIDALSNAYASESTTTLTIRQNNETHSFFLKNVSLGDMVYVSVASESPLLNRTLPLTNGWRSFEKSAIPEQFSGVAVDGPILDNALLFAEDGTYLTFIEEIRGEDMTSYIFALKDPRAQPGGTLQTLFERIGNDGRVRVWVKDGRVVLLTFLGENYHSTTTPIGSGSPITPPL